jgi:epoxyqueuosine reductase
VKLSSRQEIGEHGWGRGAAGAEPSRGLAERLAAWALEEGFDRAALVPLEPSAHGAPLRRWLERGHQAGMAWMERRVEHRLDPRRLLPGARSALCVALDYWPLADGASIDSEGDLWCGVARYARGDDYHRVMGDRLAALEERIRSAFPGCRSRRYVDTGPILERELAARAGLGGTGKNTNLLHRRAGSWFLLGQVLLDLEVDGGEGGAGRPAATGGESLTDVCGRCTRCLDACPTGALPEPYVLDARRCISYWTIEHRGTIPAAVRPELGKWVFGCDVCQEVCPYNQRPAGGDHRELELPERRRDLDLVGLLLVEREEYVERFRRSPMKRAKLEGLKRNAAIAMGNRGDRRYVPALIEALAGAEAVVRAHAAWALGRLGGEEAWSGLEQALARERDRAVRGEIEAALALRPESD